MLQSLLRVGLLSAFRELQIDAYRLSHRASDRAQLDSYADRAYSSSGMCTDGKLTRAKDSFARLGDLSRTDFLPEPFFDWAEPLAQRLQVWSNFSSVLLPFASQLSGKDSPPTNDISSNNVSCASEAYTRAACLSGLSVTVPVLRSIEELLVFQSGLGNKFTRLPLNYSGVQMDQKDGASDVSDVDVDGWDLVKERLDSCTDTCALVLMSPAIQSLVYAYREWHNHKDDHVAQVLVMANGRILWLDFRTLKDYVKLAGDSNAWGLHMLEGISQKGRSSCIDIVKPSLCQPISAPLGLTNKCKEDYNTFKAWRNRAGAPAPTDFIDAMLTTDLLRFHQPQVGPTCAAQSVANVLNGLLGNLSVSSKDVLDYYSAKRKTFDFYNRNTDTDASPSISDVFGEKRKVYYPKRKRNKFSTSNVGSGHIRKAFSNVAIEGNALAWKAKETPPHGVEAKEWYLSALSESRGLRVLQSPERGGITGEQLMAGIRARKGAEIELSKGIAEQASEWAKLKCWLDHCATGQCGVVYHLTNHYAPIYGYREFGDRRQLLVPFSGQSPSAWQDFLSVREVINAWYGYNMLVAYVGSKPECKVA